MKILSYLFVSLIFLNLESTQLFSLAPTSQKITYAFLNTSFRDPNFKSKKIFAFWDQYKTKEISRHNFLNLSQIHVKSKLYQKVFQSILTEDLIQQFNFTKTEEHLALFGQYLEKKWIYAPYIQNIFNLYAQDKNTLNLFIPFMDKTIQNTRHNQYRHAIQSIFTEGLINSFDQNNYLECIKYYFEHNRIYAPDIAKLWNLCSKQKLTKDSFFNDMDQVLQETRNNEYRYALQTIHTNQLIEDFDTMQPQDHLKKVVTYFENNWIYAPNISQLWNLYQQKSSKHFQSKFISTIHSTFLDKKSPEYNKYITIILETYFKEICQSNHQSSYKDLVNLLHTQSNISTFKNWTYQQLWKCLFMYDPNTLNPYTNEWLTTVLSNNKPQETFSSQSSSHLNTIYRIEQVIRALRPQESSNDHMIQSIAIFTKIFPEHVNALITEINPFVAVKNSLSFMQTWRQILSKHHKIRKQQQIIINSIQKMRGSGTIYALPEFNALHLNLNLLKSPLKNVKFNISETLKKSA